MLLSVYKLWSSFLINVRLRYLTMKRTITVTWMLKEVTCRLLIIVVCNYLIEHSNLWRSINILVTLKESCLYLKIISIPPINMCVTLESYQTHSLTPISKNLLAKIITFLMHTLNSLNTINYLLNFLWII